MSKIISVPVSLRLDENDLGLLRVYLENKLNASDDSVSLDGVLANKFLRFPDNEVQVNIGRQTIPAKSNPSYAPLTILDINDYIEINSLQIVTWEAISRIRILKYDASGVGFYEETATNFSWNTEAVDLQGLGTDGAKLFSHPEYRLDEIDPDTVCWRISNRNPRIICPHGIKITAENAFETPYKLTAIINYQTFRVV